MLEYVRGLGLGTGKNMKVEELQTKFKALRIGYASSRSVGVDPALETHGLGFNLEINPDSDYFSDDQTLGAGDYSCALPFEGGGNGGGK